MPRIQAEVQVSGCTVVSIAVVEQECEEFSLTQACPPTLRFVTGNATAVHEITWVKHQDNAKINEDSKAPRAVLLFPTTL